MDTGGYIMKTIGVLTSGGDAPGMNAAIRAVVRAGLSKGLKVMGIQRGYNGLINGEIYEMNNSSVSDIIQRGGTILKTARSEEFRTEEGRKKAYNVLKVFGIEGLVVIGGDGSFKGAQMLSRQFAIKTVGIPGTIDNDLAYTDYTIGFDTAVNTVLDAINKLRDTSTSHERVSIIEVMGRHCGDIALYSGIAGGAESVIIPEENYNFNELCKSIIQQKVKGKIHNLIILAEGAEGSENLAKDIQEVTGIETRLTVLGHIQRGGSPSAFDRILASRLGARAIEVLIQEQSQRVVGIKDNKIIDLDIDEALEAKKDSNTYLYELSKILSY
jgi:6-phosphofructokinase 1